MLIQSRVLKMMKYIMTLDRGPVLSPEELAIEHYDNQLYYLTFNAWATELRERGTNVRRRNKCFEAWAKFAPGRRQKRDAFNNTLYLMRKRRMLKALRTMLLSMSSVIDIRMSGLKAVKDNLFKVSCRSTYRTAHETQFSMQTTLCVLHTNTTSTPLQRTIYIIYNNPNYYTDTSAG